MKISVLLILASISATLNAKPFCISHRGVTDESIENSLTSIQRAIHVGSHGVEFDIHHTSDGEAILMHDENLERVATSLEGRQCPLTTEVRNLSLKEIQENCILKNGENIPMLEEVLSLLETENIFTFLELKDNPSKKTISLIEKYNIQKPKLLRIISFERSALKTLKKKRKHSSFWKNIELMRIYKFLPISFSNYGVNIYFKTRFMAWLPNLFGKEIGVWTVNSDKDLKKVLKRRIHFVTTDKVERCLALR